MSAHPEGPDRRQPPERPERPERIDPEAAYEYLMERRATFVDARPRPQWLRAEATIPGAVHVDAAAGAEADRALERLPRDRRLIAFCDQPSQAASEQLARRALRLGIGQVFVLEGGLRAWQAAELPLTPLPVETLALDRMPLEDLEKLCRISGWMGFGGDRLQDFGDTRDTMERFLAGMPRDVVELFLQFIPDEYEIVVPPEHAARIASLPEALRERFAARLVVLPAGLDRDEALVRVMSEGDSALLYRWLRFTGQLVPRPGYAPEPDRPAR